MNQSFAFLLSYVKTNQSCICARAPQSSSLPQSCAEEKSSGVEIGVWGCFVFDLSAFVFDFGCFVFDLECFVFEFRGASCFDLRFRVLRFDTTERIIRACSVYCVICIKHMYFSSDFNFKALKHSSLNEYWLFYPGCQRSSRSPAARSVRASRAGRRETSGSGS